MRAIQSDRHPAVGDDDACGTGETGVSRRNDRSTTAPFVPRSSTGDVQTTEVCAS